MSSRGVFRIIGGRESVVTVRFDEVFSMWDEMSIRRDIMFPAGESFGLHDTLMPLVDIIIQHPAANVEESLSMSDTFDIEMRPPSDMSEGFSLGDVFEVIIE
jgi:hypothetical protein